MLDRWTRLLAGSLAAGAVVVGCSASPSVDSFDGTGTTSVAVVAPASTASPSGPVCNAVGLPYSAIMSTCFYGSSLASVTVQDDLIAAGCTGSYAVTTFGPDVAGNSIYVWCPAGVYSAAEFPGTSAVGSSELECVSAPSASSVLVFIGSWSAQLTCAEPGGCSHSGCGGAITDGGTSGSSSGGSSSSTGSSSGGTHPGSSAGGDRCPCGGIPGHCSICQ